LGAASPTGRGARTRASGKVTALEPTVDKTELEEEIRRVGHAVADAMPSAARHPMRALDAKAMQASAGDRQLRAALFRLVDVTPACRSLDELAMHLVGFLGEVESPPPPVGAAMRVAHTKPGRAALGAATAAGVRHMAHRFIAGQSPRDALGELRSLWRAGIATSVDLLGEASLTAEEADRYAARCGEALETLGAAHRDFPERPLLEHDSLGPISRVNLSVKVSALTPLLRPEAPRRGAEDAGRRLEPIMRRARDLGAHLHVDMESLDSREATLAVLFEQLSSEELRDGPSVGVVLQAYLRDADAELDDLLERAAASGRESPLVVRLVKGAYWDHEVVEARQHGWTPPVFEIKADSDRNFERLSRRLVDRALARPGEVRIAIGSHNLRSVAHAIAYNRSRGGADADLELQVLRGLGDDLATGLAQAGFRVRSYCPVGDLVAGMAYLVRRLLENTANESFLVEQAQGADLDLLLAAP
jgi:RHH-type proline utilization regulon transcriptional repressor/proline dehydrogenase/delta 1-pyrroline-5-carboxylate dehydrogenase